MVLRSSWLPSLLNLYYPYMEDTAQTVTRAHNTTMPEEFNWWLGSLLTSFNQWICKPIITDMFRYMLVSIKDVKSLRQLMLLRKVSAILARFTLQHVGRISRSYRDHLMVGLSRKTSHLRSCRSNAICASDQISMIAICICMKFAFTPSTKVFAPTFALGCDH